MIQTKQADDRLYRNILPMRSRHGVENLSYRWDVAQLHDPFVVSRWVCRENPFGVSKRFDKALAILSIYRVEQGHPPQLVWHSVACQTSVHVLQIKIFSRCRCRLYRVADWSLGSEGLNRGPGTGRHPRC